MRETLERCIVCNRTILGPANRDTDQYCIRCMPAPELDERNANRRQKLREELADTYVRDVLNGEGTVTRVTTESFKVRYKEPRGTIFEDYVTYDQANVGELPIWRTVGENKGSAPAPSTRTAPAKAKAGRRSKAKARKQNKRRKRK